MEHPENWIGRQMSAFRQVRATEPAGYGYDPGGANWIGKRWPTFEDRSAVNE